MPRYFLDSDHFTPIKPRPTWTERAAGWLSWGGLLTVLTCIGVATLLGAMVVLFYSGVLVP